MIKTCGLVTASLQQVNMIPKSQRTCTKRVKFCICCLEVSFAWRYSMYSTGRVVVGCACTIILFFEGYKLDLAVLAWYMWTAVTIDS